MSQSQKQGLLVDTSGALFHGISLMGKTQRFPLKVMEVIRFNPYTCNPCYFNVTMKQPPETELGQFRYRNIGRRKYTTSLRLILVWH